MVYDQLSADVWRLSLQFPSRFPLMCLRLNLKSMAPSRSNKVFNSGSFTFLIEFFCNDESFKFFKHPVLKCNRKTTKRDGDVCDKRQTSADNRLKPKVCGELQRFEKLINPAPTLDETSPHTQNTSVPDRCAISEGNHLRGRPLILNKVYNQAEVF